MKSVEVGRLGERHVVNYLKEKKYTIVEWDTQAPGSTDIEAQHASAHLLVQVKTAIHPNEPGTLTSEEVRNIKSRATKINADPWEANVQISDNGQLVNVIKWSKLV